MVAGVSPYEFGAYLVPLILLVAVPSSALSIFISSSPANNNDDVAVAVDTSILNKENNKDQFEFEKQDNNVRNKKVCVAPTFYLDSNKKINYEWSNITPKIKNSKSITMDNNNNVNDEKKEKKLKKYKCYAGAGAGAGIGDSSEHSLCDDDDANDAIGGSEDRTTDSSCLPNNNDEESKEEGYSNNNNINNNDSNNNNNMEKCRRNLETDIVKANYVELPPTSTWPDYPLLVRKAPSSASHNVSRNKEKLEEFTRPIKIHFNPISETAAELHIEGIFFYLIIYFSISTAFHVYCGIQIEVHSA